MNKPLLRSDLRLVHSPCPGRGHSGESPPESLGAPREPGRWRFGGRGIAGRFPVGRRMANAPSARFLGHRSARRTQRSLRLVGQEIAVSPLTGWHLERRTIVCRRTPCGVRPAPVTWTVRGSPCASRNVPSARSTSRRRSGATCWTIPIPTQSDACSRILAIVGRP